MTLVGVCDFPCLIMMIFPVLNCRGPCLGLLLLGLIGVPNVANVATTSCSVSPRDKLVWCGCFYDSWYLEISLGLIVPSACFFPSSHLIYASLSSSSSFFLSSSSIFAAYSSVFSASHSSRFPSLPLVLEVGLSQGVMAWVFMKFSLSMSTNLVHRLGFLKWLKTSITINLMRPWWTKCWCFPSINWLNSMINYRRKWGIVSLWGSGDYALNLNSWSNMKG